MNGLDRPQFFCLHFMVTCMSIFIYSQNKCTFLHVSIGINLCCPLLTLDADFLIDHNRRWRQNINAVPGRRICSQSPGTGRRGMLPFSLGKKKSEFIWDTNLARPVTKPDDCKVGYKLLTAVREPIISPLVVLSH